MTGSTRSSEGLDPRRRRLLFRSWHRGIREADLIMGRFAYAYIGELSEADLDQYERLLEAQEQDLLSWMVGQAEVPPDQDLFGWITGASAAPAEYATALFRRLRDFHLTAGR